MRLSIDHLGPDARTSDRVLLDYDALIAPLGFGFPGESRPLWRDRMVLPRWIGAITTCTTVSHAGGPRRGCRTRWLASGPGILTPVDRVFGELDIDRRIRIQVSRVGCRCHSSSRAPTWSPSFPSGWRRMHTSADGPVVQVEPPFGEVVLAEGYWFARDRLSDPAHHWLFDSLGRGRRGAAHQTIRPITPSGSR